MFPAAFSLPHQKELFPCAIDEKARELAEELGFRARFLPAAEVPVNAELVKFCAEK